MTAAEEPQKTPEDGIEVEAEVVLDDGAIEVADDEIEVAAELPARPTQPSPPSASVIRSRPPMRPSARPRPPSGNSALPPPRVLSESASGWPPSSRPSSVDPWLLANKTLELSRAHARIAELEEQVAFRDAQILTLEEKLQKAQQLEHKSSPVAAQRVPSAAAVKPPAAAVPSAAAVKPPAAAAKPVVTETRLVAPALASAATPSASAAVSAPLEAEEDEVDELEDDSVSSSDSDANGTTTHAFEGDGVESDLRQISGIGPRFEAALRKQGITRLSQIAAWSEADVRQVAKLLKIPKSRIVKGRWVEAAREATGASVASE